MPSRSVVRVLLVTLLSLTVLTQVRSTKDWNAITSSSDGTKLAATVYDGDIWTSTDSGATWTEDTDDYSGAGTLSYLASACTVTALLLLV